MNKYTVIATEGGEYNISALLEDDGSYTMASFNFGSADQANDVWDNTNFLYNTFYPYLLGKKDDKQLSKMFSGYKEELRELFEEAEKLGFFEEEKEEKCKTPGHQAMKTGVVEICPDCGIID